MKKLLLLGCLLIPSAAKAQGLSYTLETATSSGTIYSVGIASQPAVDVTSITVGGILYGGYALEVYNHAGSTSTINCGYNSLVSTSEFNVGGSNPGAINTNYGREIAPGQSVVYHILQGKLHLFCMSQSVKGPTAATITQLR